MSDAGYELFYWPMIQGRGELVRLALEDAGAPYLDVAREPGGMREMERLMDSAPRPPFAPPFLRVGELVIAQTANILAYLGPRLSLVPADEPSRLWAHQLQLTIADFVAEAHDTHHPVGVSLYYEDQKPEARRRAREFVERRVPKFFGYFERVLERTGSYLVGAEVSYVDLSAFQIVTGLEYAFPNAAAAARADCPRLWALRDTIAGRPRIAAYLSSERRLPFDENGIFRRYPELDAST